jgi:predicted permease
VTKGAQFTVRASCLVAVGVTLPIILFAILRGAVLKDLPCLSCGRVALVFGQIAERPGQRMGMSLLNLRDLTANMPGIEEAGALFIASTPTSVRFPDGVAIAPTVELDEGTLRILGVSPIQGRWYSKEEQASRRNAITTVVVSERFWRTRLGANPAAVGKAVLLIPQPATVVGVMPPCPLLSLIYQQEPDLFVPVFTPENVYRAGYRLHALVRLEPGVALTRIQTQLSVRGRQLQAAYPGANRDFHPVALSLKSAILGKNESLIWLLFIGTGLVWLIATANFGALLAVRLEERRAELAIRSALGAGTLHIVSEIAKEAFRSAGIGAAVGAFVAWWGLDFIRTHGGWFGLPRLAEVSLDGATLLFGISSAAVAGWLGVLLNSHRNLGSLAAGVMQGGLSPRLTRSTRFAAIVVAAQFSLALIVVNMAAVTGRSLAKFQTRVLGYDARGLLAMELWVDNGVGLSETAERRRQIDVLQSVIDFTRRLPSVIDVTAAYPHPGKKVFPTFSFEVIENQPSSASRPAMAAKWDVASNYFQAMHIPLVRGRAFVPADGVSWDVALVNETFVRTYLRDREPVGRQLYWTLIGREKQFRIVGVVGDSIDTLLDDAASPAVYLPVGFSQGMDLLVRTNRPGPVGGQVQKFIRQLDLPISINRTLTVDQELQAPLSHAKTQVMLSAIFGLTSLLLAVGGLYSTVRYAGDNRRREYAIRVALGGTERQITLMRLRKTLETVAYGLLCGVIASAALGRAAQSMLFRVPAIDPLMMAAACTVLLVAAFAASYSSIRDTMRLDPGELLRAS